MAPLALLLDLDGTLLDTEALYTRAVQAVCDAYGCQFDLALKRRIMGSASRTAAQTIVDALGLPLTASAYLEAQDRALLSLLGELAPMDGAEALVEWLERRALPWAIATSGESAITSAKLAAHPFLQRAWALVCGDDPELVRGKPHPDIYWLAQRRLGVAAEACVVVEDSLHGMHAGLSAGMRTVALVDPRWGFAPGTFDAADVRIDSLRALPPWLEA